MSDLIWHSHWVDGAARPVPRMADPPAASQLHAFLSSRRSIRRYLEAPLSGDLVAALIEVAQRAPSAHHRQPWRWVVLADPVRRQRLAAAMGEAWAVDLRADGVDDEEIARLLRRSAQRLTAPPCAVLPCLTMENMDRYPDPTRQLREWQMAVQSVALATQTLMLAAHAVGLGSCWICAPIFCPDVVRATLDLPEAWEPQGLVTLGWPADNGRDRPRQPVAQTVIWR
ncbi:MAG: nitroreductase family protein [Anaerolineales bacterium]|nr:nitroreductase family protein [Anaerolineales bacterium]MCB9127330.1 nitroreductase family protein [Ardenticatenales bacterium]